MLQHENPSNLKSDLKPTLNQNFLRYGVHVSFYVNILTACALRLDCEGVTEASVHSSSFEKCTASDYVSGWHVTFPLSRSKSKLANLVMKQTSQLNYGAFA